MKLGRRHRGSTDDDEASRVDPLPAYRAAVAEMPVQCLMFDDAGALSVFAAVPIGGDDLVELDLVMSELPEHPPLSPASWLDQYLDRWHHGRFAGWRLRGEHAGNGRPAIVHPDLGHQVVRTVPPSAGVHVLGPYVRYGTGRSNGARHVRVDHDQRCAAVLFQRTVEAGVPIIDIAALAEHPVTNGVEAPPLPPRGTPSPDTHAHRPRRGPSLRTIAEPGGIVSGIDHD